MSSIFGHYYLQDVTSMANSHVNGDRTRRLRKLGLIIPFDIDTRRTGSSRDSSRYGSWRTKWKRSWSW